MCEEYEKYSQKHQKKDKRTQQEEDETQQIIQYMKEKNIDIIENVNTFTLIPMFAAKTQNMDMQKMEREKMDDSDERNNEKQVKKNNSTIKNTTMVKIQPADRCTSKIMPSSQWEIEFAYEVSERRQELAQLVASYELGMPLAPFTDVTLEKWLRRIAGHQWRPLQARLRRRTFDHTPIDAPEPFLLTAQHLACMQSMRASEIIQHLSDQIDSTFCTLDELIEAVLEMKDEEIPSQIEDAPFVFDHTLAFYTYATLLRLEKPLHADDAAALRQLFRKLCTVRTGYTEINERVIDCNIVLAMIEHTFGQSVAVE